MILDRLLTFTGNVATGTISDAITTTADSANIIDLGVGAPPPNQAIPSYALGGGARDIGVGDSPMLKLLVQVTTPFTTSANTLTCALAGAPDNGSGAPGSFTTMWTSPAVPASSMIAAGVYLANVDVPRQIPGQAMPRFLKMVFTASAALVAGQVYAGIVIDRFDQPWGGTAAAPGLSGYVPGLVVAN